MRTGQDSVRRNLAVGHFYDGDFQGACSRWLPRIAEVFFAWPGVVSCRPSPVYTDELREQLYNDLHWCRLNGIRLDTLFNCNCYGEMAIGRDMADWVENTLLDMDAKGLLPEVVTTTSPFVATVLRQRFPHVHIRASVNLRAHGTIGWEAVSDLFDEFYVSREHHRNLAYVQQVAEWAAKHGKLLGMQVNSGCLRECPFQTFHDNLHGHEANINFSERGREFNFTYFRCKTHYGRDHAFEDILKATWIRPEDVPLWEPYISVFKLATRRIANPERILAAYAGYGYDGNLLDLLDPIHSECFAPLIIDNKRFPVDWATSGIGVECAMNCTHCGRCATIFNTVAHVP